MLKELDPVTLIKLTDLFQGVWKRDLSERSKPGLIGRVLKKGDLTDCNSWRGVTLLSPAWQIVRSKVLCWTKETEGSKLREKQAGFWSERSCSEQIVALRNIT